MHTSPTSSREILLNVFTEKSVSMRLFVALKAAPEKNQAEWLKMIDESDYDLTEWMDGLNAFETWAVSQNRKLTLRHMFEYLNCCAESTRSKVKLPLVFLLNEFIKNHGVEAYHR